MKKDNLSQTFPDKKTRNIEFEQATAVLEAAQKVMSAFDIGQEEATYWPAAEYPMLPIAVLCATDIHYGSTRVIYDKLRRHLQIVEETPNFAMVTNGDHVDNFNATGKWASGMMENPLPPQLQARVMCARLLQIDALDKIGVLSHGNHDDFGENAGQDWYDSFLSKFKCPVFVAGGLLHISLKDQEYKMALNHTYWGNSKINPTNAAKRMLEYEYPQADISFLGHTHTSTYEHFDRAGKDVLALVGGTYKKDDLYAKKRGISGRSGEPGMTVLLWPNERRMQMFKDIETALIVMQALIGEANHFRKTNIPKKTK